MFNETEPPLYIIKLVFRFFVKIISFIYNVKKRTIVSLCKSILAWKQQYEYEVRLRNFVLERTSVKRLLASSRKIIYFPLHLQPELTTSSIGGVYQDQLYALEIVRELFDDDWMILVKENPHQNYFQRDSLFFQRISNISEVYLVDKDFPTYEIIEKATLTATITGTAGWESIKGGGKCLVFGQAWYSCLDNCLTYYPELSKDNLLKFLDNKVNFSQIILSFESLMRRGGLGVVDVFYERSVEGYNAKENAENVTNSLMKIINHSETIWK